MAEEPKEPTPQRPHTAEGAKEIALRPKNFEETWAFCKLVCETDFVAPADRGKAGQVLAKIQYGNEVGLPPMQSLRWITHINGVPSIWGDGFWMLVRSHPLVEWVKETRQEDALKQGWAEVTIKRRGDPEPVTRRFSVEEATTAGLIERGGPKGPWNTYRGNQLVWRARHRTVTAAVPEALGGLVPTEIATDYDVETTATETEKPIEMPKPKETKADAPKQTADNKPDTVKDNGGGVQSPVPTATEGATTEAAKESKGKSKAKPAEVKKEPPKEDEPQISLKNQLLAWISTCSYEQLQSFDKEKSRIANEVMGIRDPMERQEVLTAWDLERRTRPEPREPGQD